jgi:hypothetical protein
VVTITAPWKSDPLISPRGLGLVMTITAMMITMMGPPLMSRLIARISFTY